MRKVGTGYTNYFNKKYDRVGPLFQGSYKMAHVLQDSHLLYLPFYIHLNPLDMLSPQWRDGEIANTKEALSFLESYRWSSYLDYIGQKNFPSVTERDFILSLYKTDMRKSNFRISMFEWLQEHGVDDIESLTLE